MLHKCCYPEPVAGTGAGSTLDRLHNTGHEERTATSTSQYLTNLITFLLNRFYTSGSDPYSLNPDPDPATNLNLDPEGY